MASLLLRTCRVPNVFRFIRQYSTSASVTDSLHRECYLQPLLGTDTGITILSLHRPHAKNAISLHLLQQLQECICYLQDDPNTRVIIIRSLVDKVFCAGADLKERATMKQSQVSTFVTQLRSTFSQVQQLPMPTIAAIDGAALGGGLELALCCDLRTAGPLAKFGLPETKLAIIPGAGGSQRLPRIIGIPLAKELMFTGRIITSPQEALDIQLVNRISDTNAMDAALPLARDIVNQGPVALKMAKIAIDKGMQVDLLSGLHIEQLCYAQVIPTKDRLEGLKAFAEKRKPIFKGE